MENKAALVLVLDPDIRRAIAEALETHGITALCCDTIGCCRSRLLNGIIDMCLLSQRLADGDALDLVRELRATEAAIGLIVLGEGHDELDAVLALEMGADDYLGGPPRMRELVARVTAVLRRLPAASDEVTRRFAAMGTRPDHALAAQGLHQLYRTRCQEGRCLTCPIGRFMLGG